MVIKKIMILIISIIVPCMLLCGCYEKSKQGLYIAIEYDNLEMAKESVKLGCSVDYFAGITNTMESLHTKIDRNPLYADIILHSQPRIGYYLISQGADVNYQDKDGISILMLSAINGNLSLCKKLIDEGADLTKQDNKKQTAIDYTLKFYRNTTEDSINEKKVVNLVKLLYSSGSEITNITQNSLINGFDKEGETVGHHYGVIKFLIENNILKLENFSKNEKIFYQASIGQLDAIEEAIKNGFDIKSSNCNNENILMIGAKYGKKKIVRYAIENGVDIKEKNYNDYDYTALDYAVANSNFHVVKYLVELQKLSQKQIYDLINIGLRYDSNIEIIEYLTNLLGDIEYYAYNKYETVLFNACEYDRKDVVSLFIDNGAKVNAEMLSVSVYTYDKELVDILLSTGIDVNQREKYSDGSIGESALKIAVEKGDYEMVEFLLDKGANTEDAIEFVKDDNYSENIRMLVEKYLE